MREKVVKVSEQLAEMTTVRGGLEHELGVAQAELKEVHEEQQAERKEREQVDGALSRSMAEAKDKGQELEVVKQDLRDVRTRLEATEKALEATSSTGSRDSAAITRSQPHRQQSALAIRDRTLDYLPASVRHKRQVSLNALKARLGSNAMPNGNGHTSHATDSIDDGTSTPPSGGTKGARLDTLSVREQWGDEIMFCCPACEGDLINL